MNWSRRFILFYQYNFNKVPLAMDYMKKIHHQTIYILSTKICKKCIYEISEDKDSLNL